MRQFSQERFVQELCCDSFAMASTSRPYSSLRTSSRALVWDPGSTESIAQRSHRPRTAPVVSLGTRQQLRSQLHVILHYKRLSVSTWACFRYKAHIEGLVWHMSKQDTLIKIVPDIGTVIEATPEEE